MRLSLSTLLLAAALAAPSIAVPPPKGAEPASLENDVLNVANPAGAAGIPPIAAADSLQKLGSEVKAGSSTQTESVDDALKSTVFNGITVPPMKELRGPTFDEEVKDGYWFVKFFSPDCPHCQDIAPTWQTLYEFYYTSDPLPSSKSDAEHSVSLNSFHGYYNFHFASINCIAFMDTCTDKGIQAWPTFLLYKDGKEFRKFTGKKTMEGLSIFIEETLETIKPGSRQPEGVNLPQPGDKTSPAPSKPVIPPPKDKDAAADAAADKQNAIASHTTETTMVATSSTATAMTTTLGTTGTMEVKKTTSTLSATKIAPAKPSVTPNPAGLSIPLTQESFQKLVTTSQEPWFIKFYAPWCHHCQALAPNWHQMARELQGILNVGEVNCDQEKRLCKDAGVKGYPTIHFFRGGERVEYDGLRGLGDLVSYAKKAVDIGRGVQYVDAATFKEMEETEEVIFVYFYDHATTEEDFAALERLTLSLVGHAKLVKTDSSILSERFKIHTWPRLLVSRDGRPSYYNALAPSDMRDFRRVLNWMQTVWLPIVPELTASNSREIMNGRFVVLGILSRERTDEFMRDKRELKNAALEWMDREVQAFQLERQELRDSKQLRIEEAQDRDDERALRDAKLTQIHITEQDRKQVGFAWVDGVFWERWVRTTYGVDIRDGERVIINDEDNKRYWDTTITGAPIIPSRSYILETLQKITADPPKISPKYTTGAIEQVYLQAKGASISHPYIASIIFVALLVVAYMASKGKLPGQYAHHHHRGGRGRRGTGGGAFFLDGKEGLLGGSGGAQGVGKND